MKVESEPDRNCSNTPKEKPLVRLRGTNRRQRGDVVAVAAAFAEGETTVTDAAELRTKESDRIARVVAGLRALGADADERADGFVVRGGVRPGPPAVVDASGDHRLAMAFAVAGLARPGGVVLRAAGEVHTSYPRFFEDLATLCNAP